jgi:malate synthase
VLSPEALTFIATLSRAFAGRVDELLRARGQQQAAFDTGASPEFDPETRQIRESEWTVADLPLDLRQRRVEITGPVDRKMIINALNSGADVFMADFEDSNSPTWANVIGGQLNLRDAVRRQVDFVHPVTGKSYELAEACATLMVRPRGWHLIEHHLRVDGRPVPASLVDFGLYFFHNAWELLNRGSGPYFYLPKLQGHLEARLWNDVFVLAQNALGIPQGTIKATVLIETFPAALEMDEILWELREHSAGLNCGRWDYIFSFIKTFRADSSYLCPERSQVGMTQPFMRAYTRLCIRTCHRRGVHALGGMAAQIPIKGDADANDAALAKVRGDKLREVQDGHDGTWVAHPALVPLAMEVFDTHMEGEHQIHRTLDDLVVTAEDLCAVPLGTITEDGLRQNINVGLLYLEAWLAGNGCVPLYHLMEDAATAEISRTQVWQWLQHGATLDDGRLIDSCLFRQVFDEELAAIEHQLGSERFAAGQYVAAADLFTELSLGEELADFLTLRAYRLLVGAARTETATAPAGNDQPSL